MSLTSQIKYHIMALRSRDQKIIPFGNLKRRKRIVIRRSKNKSKFLCESKNTQKNQAMNPTTGNEVMTTCMKTK